MVHTVPKIAIHFKSVHPDELRLGATKRGNSNGIQMDLNAFPWLFAMTKVGASRFPALINR